MIIRFSGLIISKYFHQVCFQYYLLTDPLNCFLCFNLLKNDIGLHNYVSVYLIALHWFSVFSSISTSPKLHLHKESKSGVPKGFPKCSEAENVNLASAQKCTDFHLLQAQQGGLAVWETVLEQQERFSSSSVVSINLSILPCILWPFFLGRAHLVHHAG